MMWFKKINANQIELSIYAKPNAKRSALVAISETELHIALHAKPHEGEANAELIEFLSELFQLPKSQISLQRGARGRHKRVLLPLNATIHLFLADPLKWIVKK